MTTFFKAASFGKSTDVLKFNTIFKNSAPTIAKAAAKQQNKKKKKKLKKTAENITENNKIQSGRVEKQQKKKQHAGVNAAALPASKQHSNKKQQIKTTAKTIENKVLSGRIKKQKKKKGKPQQQQQQLVAKKSILKAAILNVNSSKSAPDTDPVDALAAQLKQSLKGGRFRYINEQLYTMDSKAAAKLFKTEPDAFEAYHEGYRQQLEKWPTNPLKRIIKVLSRLPKTHEIGDFGCGEAELAKRLPNKVYSIDLVALSDDIIACDMAHTPLNTHALDVAVYCLSLMGTNLHDYLLEANRVLKVGGLLYIADIQSRFDKNLYPFTHMLEVAGFKLIKKEEDSNVFYHFQFKKTGDVGKVAKLPEFTLRPCLYKKR